MDFPSGDGYGATAGGAIDLLGSSSDEDEPAADRFQRRGAEDRSRRRRRQGRAGRVGAPQRPPPGTVTVGGDNDDQDDTSVELVLPSRPAAGVRIGDGAGGKAHDAVTPAAGGSSPLDRLLAVLPDVDTARACEALREAGLDDPAAAAGGGNAAVEAALGALLEGGSYPRRSGGEGGGGRRRRRDGRGGRGDGTLVLAAPRRGREYLRDYASEPPSSSPVPSDAYRREVTQRLMVAFCFLSRAGADLHLAEVGGRYALCYGRVCDLLVADRPGFAPGGGGGDRVPAFSDPLAEERAYRRLIALRGGAPLTRDESDRLGVRGMSCTVRRSRRSYRPPEATDEVLLDEVAYAAERLEDRYGAATRAADRRRAHEASERDGTALECSCCYLDFAFEELVACRDEGHLFCVDCLRRHAEERVFGIGSFGGGGKQGRGGAEAGEGEAPERNEITCMHMDGCESGFPLELLRKALPAKVMEKYNELQATRALEIAGMEGLARCPRCGFQAVLDPAQMVFLCPVETCRFESCRKCGEPSHIPLRCEEVEKEVEADGRKKVEEAMTAARVRTCPKPGCGKRFYKVQGCNKMTCSCGTYMCYVCRKELPRNSVYSHYCQTAHCQHKACNKCPLYTDTAADDLRAAKEAGIKAAEEVRKESVTGGDGKDGAGVDVDVDALLKGAEQPKARNHRQVPFPPAARPNDQYWIQQIQRMRQRAREAANQQQQRQRQASYDRM